MNERQHTDIIMSVLSSHGRGNPFGSKPVVVRGIVTPVERLGTATALASTACQKQNQSQFKSRTELLYILVAPVPGVGTMRVV